MERYPPWDLYFKRDKARLGYISSAKEWKTPRVYVGLTNAYLYPQSLGENPESSHSISKEQSFFTFLSGGKGDTVASLQYVSGELLFLKKLGGIILPL